jgi:phosphonopyruvate decarboxylase
MMTADAFLSQCRQNGFQLFSGTPCSYLKPLINAVIDDEAITYLTATNEGDAVAMICGAGLSGRRGVVMFQNSGLGNAVNPLTSLAYTFRFPFLLIVTHRGQPGGPPDEPQHDLMGRITEAMLDTMAIRWERFPDDENALPPVFARAAAYMNETGQPYALVLRKGMIAPRDLTTPKAEKAIGRREVQFYESLSLAYSERATRTEALEVILRRKRPEDVIIATTGKTGRELYTLEDSAAHLYMVGSMGCASSFALGAALTFPNHRWLTVDGDAATLMRMGNLATIGHYRPDNYLHLVLDNEINDSTGGQASVSAGVSLGAIAMACGYRQAYSTDGLHTLDTILAGAAAQKGPTLIHFRIRRGSPADLGRPKIKPFEVKDRLMAHLSAPQT